jgi:hypothetical protein
LRRDICNWKYQDRIVTEIQAYKSLAKNVKVELVSWESIVLILPATPGQNDNPFAYEFRTLLEEHFGPIRFEEEEISVMFSETFPLPVLLRLNKLVFELNKKAGKKYENELEIYEKGFGFYLRKKNDKRKKCWLYCGIWLDFWDAGNHYPLCFGVENVSDAVKEAFKEAVKAVYKREALPFECDGENWLMSWISQAEFDAPDMTNHVWEKIERIWRPMLEARTD